MKTNKSNQELLLQIKNGDRVAFYFLYERYSRKLYGFVYGFIKNETDTEEIVQEVFVKIWESRNKIDAYSSFESFIFTIAYNTTISLFRKRLSEKNYIEYLKAQQESFITDLVDEIHYNELENKVKSLLDDLTPRQKEIFQMSREKGLSNAEIANKLDISEKTVKKHISNTLSFLRSNIGGDLIVSLLYFYLFLK